MKQIHQTVSLKVSLLLLMVISLGCSKMDDEGSSSADVNQNAKPVVSKGERIIKSEKLGSEENKAAKRQEIQELFGKLEETRSADEEKLVVGNIAKWLKKHECKVRIESSDDKTMLLCPYFPPVTPWVSHKFHDAGLLELLPRID